MSMARIFGAAAAAIFFVSVLSGCAKKQDDAAPGGEAQIPQRYAQDAQMMEAALKSDPGNAGLLVQLGNLYYDWGEEEVSKKGELAQPLEKWTKAVHYYKQALDVEPGNVNVRVDMANLLRYTGDVDEALGHYRTAIKQDPKHPQARINLVLALGQLKKDYKGAVREYDALMKAIPEQAANTALKQEVDSFREMLKEGRK